MEDLKGQLSTVPEIQIPVFIREGNMETSLRLIRLEVPHSQGAVVAFSLMSAMVCQASEEIRPGENQVDRNLHPCESISTKRNPHLPTFWVSNCIIAFEGHTTDFGLQSHDGIVFVHWDFELDFQAASITS